MKVKYGNSAGRPIKRSEKVIAPRRISPVQFWDTIDIHDYPKDLNKSIQIMKNQLIDRNVNLELVRSSWKKTLFQRRNFIRNLTTKEVLEEYPSYFYASLVCSSLSFLTLYNFFIKFFVKDFRRDSINYEVIGETSSIDEALCIIISLYVIFELQFGIHNRIIQLLYGILLKQSGALTKPLRVLLNQWNSIIDKKEDEEDGHMVTTNSANCKTLTATVQSLTQVEDNQTDDLPDSEEQEEMVSWIYCRGIYCRKQFSQGAHCLHETNFN
ncbi:unnamed protein product [Adineta steineri]|uniref:Uncharacterized protein n=1 Tax=Adineta steineri TaxID=433720 RepID=A0A819VJ51_9BILA|nr:unnamed protein product [Adineta steineri]